MLRPFIWMPIAFIMPKSRVWGNEIHIKITTCKEYESHEMANAYYTSGSCSRKIEAFTYMGNDLFVYNLVIKSVKNYANKISLIVLFF